jgi:hypothetical protein
MEQLEAAQRDHSEATRHNPESVFKAIGCFDLFLPEAYSCVLADFKRFIGLRQSWLPI